MYIRFKKVPEGLVQITDIHGGLPFPHTYFKFTEESLPEQSSQWFEFLNNKIFVVIEIVGSSPKLDKYKKCLQDTPEPVLQEKAQATAIIHEKKQVIDKQEEKEKIEEIKKNQVIKEKAQPKRTKRVISDEKEIEEKVKNFLKI